MSYDEGLICRQALLRLAAVFNVPEDAMTPSMRFGHELKASPSSDFQRNEFDIIDDDIKDVADKETRNAMANGTLEIVTVQDYCDHMVRCNGIKSKEVERVLGLSSKS